MCDHNIKYHCMVKIYEWMKSKNSQQGMPILKSWLWYYVTKTTTTQQKTCPKLKKWYLVKLR